MQGQREDNLLGDLLNISLVSDSVFAHINLLLTLRNAPRIRLAGRGLAAGLFCRKFEMSKGEVRTLNEQ